MTTDNPLYDAVMTALSTVLDPEIKKPLTELNMVKSIVFTDANVAQIEIWLTVSGCPLRDTIIRNVTEAVTPVEGVTGVQVELDVMSAEQRTALGNQLRGDRPAREIPFAAANSLTKVYAVASGKGGVGKSTVTANLAVSLAQQGLSVGVLDADIYGFSIPRLMGVTAKPTQVDQMIMPPEAFGVKVVSMAMFTPENTPVIWRGPMLHRVLTQFLSDVYWGDLDILLIDLPPGTGDIAISLGQLVPSSEILVVTTPQLAAREVAERAGSIAVQTHQDVVGVVENMGSLRLPDGTLMDIFGSGGGEAVSEGLTKTLGHDVPLLGSIPLDMGVRTGGDTGLPIVISDPDGESAKALRLIAERLAGRGRGLAGRSLGLTPKGR